MILNKIISILKSSGSILLLPHVSADGDALGASFALGLALEGAGKRVSVLLEEEIPYIYSFLPGKRLAKVYTQDAPGFDAAVALDTGDAGRLGKRAEVFSAVPVTVNIDHHRTNSNFAGYNYVHSQSSSVGEIIYQLINMMGLEIDRDISTCLYVAIATDTGGFRYSNTTSVTHRIAGDLVNNGVNVSEISQRVFDSTSLEKVRLMGSCINTLEILENGKLAVMTVTEGMLKEAGAKEEDCEGLVNIGRNIREVEVSVVLRETADGAIKVNLRSNSFADVAGIAYIFEGGGHKRAAGCTVKGSLGDVREKLLGAVREELARGERQSTEF